MAGEAVAAAGAGAPDPEAEALSPEGVAGDAMDAAVAHCRRGEREAALALFEAIVTQLDPPAALRRLIEELRASGCPAPSTGWARALGLRLLATGGRDSNVNQGVTVRTLALGTTGQTFELPLSDSYRPRPSGFWQLAAEGGRVLGAGGGAVQLALVARQHSQAPDFDQLSAAAAWSRAWEAGGRPLRLRAELAHVELGGQAYQRALGLSAQRELARGGAGHWAAQVSALRLRYPGQSGQDALLTEQGLVWERPAGDGWSAQAVAVWQQDRSLGLRPGGDRSGIRMGLQASVRVGAWRLQSEWSALSWRSSERFAPGLIDQRRRHRPQALGLAAAHPLPSPGGAGSPAAELLLEARLRSSLDTVPLYAYRGHAVSASLLWRW